MTFVSRLVLVVGLSVMVTLGAIVGAAFFAGERVSAQIEQARVSHLLGTLRAATEANLSIGLQLDEIAQLQASIERERAADSSVVAIDIFNATGRSIYSTDRGSIGELVGRDWVDDIQQDRIWRSDLQDETVFGTRFENDLGVAGGIAVTVSDSSRFMRSRVLGVDLGVRAALIGGGALFLSILVALIFSSVLGRPFVRVARILQDPNARPVQGRKLERLAGQVREEWSQSQARIERGTRQLEALDDAE